MKLWQFAGFCITSLLGTLLHYLYDWTGKNPLVALVSGVNESTWEHMKLLYFPLVIFAVVQYFFFKDRKDYWCVKLVGTLTGLALIPVIFYTYNGAVGKSPDWFNIAIFFISAAAVYFLEYLMFKACKLCCNRSCIAFWGLVSISVLFIVFTFAPPKIPLFLDPLTLTYGI